MSVESWRNALAFETRLGFAARMDAVPSKIVKRFTITRLKYNAGILRTRGTSHAAMPGTVMICKITSRVCKKRTHCRHKILIVCLAEVVIITYLLTAFDLPASIPNQAKMLLLIIFAPATLACHITHAMPMEMCSVYM